MFIKGVRKVREGRFLKDYEIDYVNSMGENRVYDIVSHYDINDVSELGTAVAGVSMAATSGDRLLLLHEMRLPAGHRVYNFCAGYIDPGESVEDCIRRELWEETGLRLVQVKQLLRPAFAAVALSDMKNVMAFVEVEGEIEPHAEADEDIVPGLYTRQQVAELVSTQDFSSRAQAVAWAWSKGMSW